MEAWCLLGMVPMTVAEKVSVKVPWKEKVKVGDEDVLGLEKRYA
jgi:hypothetical protein